MVSLRVKLACAFLAAASLPVMGCPDLLLPGRTDTTYAVASGVGVLMCLSSIVVFLAASYRGYKVAIAEIKGALPAGHTVAAEGVLQSSMSGWSESPAVLARGRDGDWWMYARGKNSVWSARADCSSAELVWGSRPYPHRFITLLLHGDTFYFKPIAGLFGQSRHAEGVHEAILASRPVGLAAADDGDEGAEE